MESLTTLKPRCPDCDAILTALYRQRRGPPPRPGVLGKLENTASPWLECEACNRVFPRTE